MYERFSCLVQSLTNLGYKPLFCLAGKAAGELLLHTGIKVIWASAVHPSYQFTDMDILLEVIDLIEAGGEAPTTQRVMERLEVGRAAARAAGQCAGKIGGKIVGECMCRTGW
jgi:hypothetical protein